MKLALKHQKEHQVCKMSLEDRLKKREMKGPGFVRRTFNHFVTLADSGYRKQDLDTLKKDKRIRELGLTDEQLYDHIQASYKKHDTLFNLGKVADTDGLTSIVGVPIKMIGALAGLVGAPAVHVGEEVVENLLMKTPFMAYTAIQHPERRGYLIALFTGETVASSVPGINSVMDIGFKPYLSLAREIILDDAKAQILNDYTKPELVELPQPTIPPANVTPPYSKVARTKEL